ncbi:RNHCP domain-containing protein [Marininema mesophilum]|uniref:RNHCP domain-containing protein n=1 Tax=Marininema mesophilum TaxID=1048340 RepID=A0A1H3ABJ7_9BACL|nr:RNHCP domain-containing protein [Marininema mesophilum]SDX27036.1 RNHCP domain-containing protein [Marininema mesophilum]
MAKKRDIENTSFICANCNREVLPLVNGSYRNHCPFCLHSIHVDLVPGDRLSNCYGLMQPIGIEYKSKKGYQIIFRCKKCGHMSRNKVATEDPKQPDDIEKIAQLSSKDTGLE